MGFIRSIQKQAERSRTAREEAARAALFEASVDAVDHAVKAIRSLTDAQLRDPAFLEEFIAKELGLNDEHLWEQPPELAPYFGTGLRLWQYPRQLAPFLSWLYQNAADCERYLEIGARWGGTFIVVCEVLRRASPRFTTALAADLVAETPFLRRYREISGLEIRHFQGSSTSEEFARVYREFAPDVAFVDGDHSLAGAMKDHLLVRDAKIVIHHDVCSTSCPDTTLLWQALKQLEAGRRHVEFVEHYESVGKPFLGIGALYA